jgi:hypothetical protein
MLSRRHPHGQSQVLWSLLCLLAAAPGTALAQVQADDDPTEVPADPAGPDIGTLAIQFDLAPEVVTHSPFRMRSWTSSATNASITFRVTEPIGTDWEIALDAGPSINIAHDRDVQSESAVGGSIEIRARHDIAGLRPFVGYAVERSYSGVFEADGATGHSLYLGLGLQRSRGPTAFALELSPRWSFGPAGLEHQAINLWGEIVHPLIPDALALQADASIERRWHSGDLSGQHDWRFQGWAGLDAAEAMNRGVGSKAFRNLGAGLRWMRISSNDPSASRTTIALLPALTMRFNLR